MVIRPGYRVYRVTLGDKNAVNGGDGLARAGFDSASVRRPDGPLPSGSSLPPTLAVVAGGSLPNLQIRMQLANPTVSTQSSSSV